MPVDYLGLHEQAKTEAVKAKADFERVRAYAAEAKKVLASSAKDPAAIRDRIASAVRADSRTRCAVPTDETINRSYPLPAAPKTCTLIAADGSQINPDRHEPLHYFLVNLGAIIMRHGSSDAPVVHVESELEVAEYTRSGSYTQDEVGLRRNKGERVLLARLAKDIKERPLITLTDGPLELWGEKTQGNATGQDFGKDLEEYLEALEDLHQFGSATAGYVDKPRAGLIVRTLELMSVPAQELGQVLQSRPYRGVTDTQLLNAILTPGERSAVFATQSLSAAEYKGELALHFFYLNVGRTGAPWLARVEIPAWVAHDKLLLDALHAVLIEQTAIIGGHTYPYALHRAHEIALVKFEEHEQVSQLLMAEMRGLGIEPGELSSKQAAKNLEGRRRYAR